MNRRVLAILCLVGMFSVVGQATHAASLYQPNEKPIDTDVDGLTDQGEMRLFGTDPSSVDTDHDGYFDSTEVLLGSNPTDANSIPTQPVVKKYPSPWPWFVTRAAGFTSYLLLWLIVMFGLGLSTNVAYRIMSPTTGWTIHRTLGLSLAGTVSFHIGGLLLDSFIHLKVVEVFVPFVSTFRTTPLALGIIGFYIILPVIVTSLVSITRHARFWRLTHYLTLPMFVLLFLHGLLIGTDRTLPVVQGMYLVTGLLAGVAIFLRLAASFGRRMLHSRS